MKLKSFILLLTLLSTTGLSVQIYLTKIESSSGNSEIYPGDKVYLHFKIINNDGYTTYLRNHVEFEILNNYFLKDWEDKYTYSFDTFSPTEEKDFIFSFNVPETTPPGKYKIKLTFSGEENGNNIKYFYQSFYIYITKPNYFDVSLNKNYYIKKDGILNYDLIIKPKYKSKNTILTVESEQLKLIGNEQFFLGNMENNTFKKVPLKFYIPNDLSTGVYPIKIKIEYQNYKNELKVWKKTLYVFVDNEKNKNFKLICSPNYIYLGENILSCKLEKIENYTPLEIDLPNIVIGNKTIILKNESPNKTTKLNVFINKEGIVPFCVNVLYKKEDKKEYSETDCFNLFVQKPEFNINIIPDKNTIILNKENNISFTVKTDKNLEDLSIYINGEIIGKNLITNRKKFNLIIYPKTKNGQLIFNIFWKYKGINYNKTIYVFFKTKENINSKQIFIYYNKNQDIIGIANRGKNKIYNCYLTIKEKNETKINKYIGDLDSDDYDQTEIKTLKNGKYLVSVNCLDDQDNLIENKKTILIKKEVQKEKNNDLLSTVILIIGIILIIFILYKIIKK